MSIMKQALLGVAVLLTLPAQAIDPNRIFHLSEIGVIKEIAIISSDIGKTNKDYLTIAETSSYTDEGMSCLKFNDNVIFRFREDAQGRRMMSAAIMAKATGLEVYAAASHGLVDDEGFCYLTLLVLSPGKQYFENGRYAKSPMPEYDDLFR